MKQRDYKFKQHYLKWCTNEEFRLQRAAVGITRNHKTAAHVSWVPTSWDEEHPDDPYYGDAFAAFGHDKPTSMDSLQIVEGAGSLRQRPAATPGTGSAGAPGSYAAAAACAGSAGASLRAGSQPRHGTLAIADLAVHACHESASPRARATTCSPARNSRSRC